MADLKSTENILISSENFTHGITKFGESQALHQVRNIRSQLDHQLAATIANYRQQTLADRTQIRNQVARIADRLDDLANALAQASQSQFLEQLSHGLAQLNDKVLGVLAGNHQDAVNHWSQLLEESVGIFGVRVVVPVLATLQATANGTQQVTNGLTQGVEANAVEEALDILVQLNQEIASVLAGDDQKLLDGGAQIRDQLANAAGILDDVAHGLSKAGQAQAGKNVRNGLAELDEQLFGAITNNGQKVIRLNAQILKEMAGAVAVAVFT
ncbi:hypothetical protein CBS115988_8497 [Aspergillus niger]|nr:hypothetical protein CBS115988_8497 [Aspergillus niger]KAI2891679.1 hypothetical protein CBS11852_6078 [Aspergillus niger]